MCCSERDDVQYDLSLYGCGQIIELNDFSVVFPMPSTPMLCYDCAGRPRVTKAVYTLTILPDARTVRERFAAGCPCTHCVHCVGFVRYTETTSGGVRSGRERFAAGWLCSVNARVDASDASGRERRTVCPCLLTDLFISTDTIHMTRKGDILCHELSTCNCGIRHVTVP